MINFTFIEKYQTEKLKPFFFLFIEHNIFQPKASQTWKLTKCPKGEKKAPPGASYKTISKWNCDM